MVYAFLQVRFSYNNMFAVTQVTVCMTSFFCSMSPNGTGIKPGVINQKISCSLNEVSNWMSRRVFCTIRSTSTKLYLSFCYCGFLSFLIVFFLSTFFLKKKTPHTHTRYIEFCLVILYMSSSPLASALHCCRHMY